MRRGGREDRLETVVWSPPDERRRMLSALDAAVRALPGVACGIVPRKGLPVLHVISSAEPARSVEIGGDYLEGAWHFVCARSGARLGSRADLARVALAAAEAVGAPDGHRA
ncbi:hypothetical protein [Actinomadura parmotrematis]|uniref:Uncharacterized protein n=1 Tax=Actinomadura parmotrematis TaxID=2864039 RepID=A0ABS7FNL9_9ACTN|nr:hypothetical protein [Actinomadura parmotrematis]MBW8481956.1 hypothetical protein [Actinomadura parmotrematis]